MKITKYVAPVSPIDAVFDRLGFGLPAIDRFFGDLDSTGESGWSAVRLPRTNVAEIENAYVFTLEMPGLSREQVEVNIEGDTLMVKGGVTQQAETQEGVLRSEFRASRFERTFKIGDRIDRDHVKAKMQDGILTITLPKSPENVGRKVEIQ
ncbi:MAG TPA: Hsp20/alpha crystallin family protein [Candidatus Krumholzibacteria bacterium]|nr:Hsp20/alpha crystallin family protein [Candidatus Krumholzibacteria bacterium]